MGALACRSPATKAAHGSKSLTTSDNAAACDVLRLPPGMLPSFYQQRLMQLAQQAAEQPPDENLDLTIRQSVAFCYNVTPEWAPHVRVTVYADNPSEHQTNVPVYDTLRVTWGLHDGEGLDTRCRPIPGTDVSSGHAKPSPFWSRTVTLGSSKVPYRDLLNCLLRWFLALPDDDKRKQLLVNLLLQLHEACYNCIGRHKEVFEYCVYDLLEAEESGATGVPEGAPGGVDDLGGSRRAISYHADRFLDRHKRAALHGAILSPLKMLFRGNYEVFENLDSHGTSFWAAVLTEVFFQGLLLPFESIVGLDLGWTWGAVDFLPALQASSEGRAVLAHFAAPENLGRDFFSLSREVQLPIQANWQVARLPLRGARRDFGLALAEARKRGSQLRAALEPYAARFAGLMRDELVLRSCALAFVGSERWDAELGPALAALSGEALGEQLTPVQVRERICGDCTDAAALEVDVQAFALLLRSAGVAWS